MAKENARTVTRVRDRELLGFEIEVKNITAV